jgi:arsenate reductase-like glutaredoxin family protein
MGVTLMNNWTLYGKSGNPSSEITKLWLKNNGIPVENISIYQITKEEIDELADLIPGGAKNLAYPDTFSFSLINPQKKKEQHFIDEIHSGKLTEDEIRQILFNSPSLLVTPILKDSNTLVIGYDLEEMNSTFRFVKVKDVMMA